MLLPLVSVRINRTNGGQTLQLAKQSQRFTYQLLMYQQQRGLLFLH